jgi:hypothetical protein
VACKNGLVKNKPRSYNDMNLSIINNEANKTMKIPFPIKHTQNQEENIGKTCLMQVS